MGIDSVAIKTFNSTGSQSVCRANDADDTKLIESEFLTKCKTEYINGSGMSFIAGTLTALPDSTTSSETYHLPSDVDAVSEIILQMRFKCSALGGNTQISSTLLLDLINKIDMKIGNLTFQTIFPGDIYARNLTENGNSLKVEHKDQTGLSSGGVFNASGTFFDFSVSIPFTGRNSDLRGCFLQAGAITNGLIMKVTYNQVPSVLQAGGAVHNLIALASTTDVTAFSTGICVFTHHITNVEKNFLQNNIVNRTVKASQGIRQLKDLSASGGQEDKTIVVDLSNININVSHILLSLERGVFGSLTTVNSGMSNADKNVIESGSSWTPVADSDDVGATKIGVFKGWLKNAELVLGNDRTGNIPVSCLTTNRIEQFGLTSIDNKNIYIIKLAGSAFSTAGVPFARLNNKKLILTLNSLVVTNFAGGVNTTLLNVTCCGTQVQTTVGGSTSFSA